jgi:non-specific serine/threonine protein kinase/serine/threonine-protein kinase
MVDRTLPHGEPLPGPAPPLREAALAIGPYRLEQRLGEGGMGEVWLAEQTAPVRRQVAVKLIKAGMDSRRVVARFEAERQALALMEHPAIARVFDGGSTPDGHPYFVMEYVPGLPLNEHCDRERLTTRQRLELFAQVCDGVQHAHHKAVVHRDLKPSNVLVTLVDGRPLPKIIDFGIAKAMARPLTESALSTEVGALIGTPEYMSPEQADPTSEDVDTRADVYSLGAMLYELLSGALPFPSRDLRSSSLEEMRRKIREVDPLPPSARLATLGEAASEAAQSRGATAEALAREVRGDLDAIAMKALEKERSRRYGSPGELAADIGRYLRSEPILAQPASAGYRVRKFAARNRGKVAAASGALLALLAGVVGTSWEAVEAGRQRARAIEERERANREARTATAQRDFAFRQLARAEAVADLNGFLLYEAAPNGQRFTAADLLDRAERIVSRQQPAADATRVDLLAGIGREYALLEDLARSRQILDEAYHLSRASDEPSTRAKAACALAATLARSGEGARGEALVREALAALPEEPQLILDRLTCLLRGSEVARDGGDPSVAVDRARAAGELLTRVGFPAGFLSTRVALDLAESYRVAGRLPEAAAAFERASALLASLGRDDTETAGTLLNNWAVALDQLGRPLEAEALFRRAIRISSAGGREATVSPQLLKNLATVLEKLHRLPEAASLAERAQALAWRAHHEVAVNQALLARAAVYRTMGDLPRAARMLAQVEPRLRRMLPPGHYAFASLELQRSLLRQSQGDLGAARAAADRAVSLAEASGQGAWLLSALLAHRAEVELQAHRWEEARRDAERALAEGGSIAGSATPSRQLGLASLALGRALRALGDPDGARASFASASAHLRASLGPTHPLSRTAARLAAGVTR